MKSAISWAYTVCVLLCTNIPHFASKDIWSSSTIFLFYSSLSHFYTFTGTFSRASEEEFNVPPRNMMSPGFYNQSSLPFYHPLCFLCL